MIQTEQNSKSHPDPNLDRYVRLLSFLFAHHENTTFDLACTLLRLGISDQTGWDPLHESREILDDLIRLNQLKLPANHFINVEKTHWRLHFLSYAHLIEMDSPYYVLTNLLRIQTGLPYSVHPFQTKAKHVPKAYKRKKTQMGIQRLPVFNKIGEIKMLAAKAGMSRIGDLFDEFYFSGLRNSIVHSDYVLIDEEMHLVADRISHEKNPRRLTSIIPYARLMDIMEKAYNFYSAFFTLEALALSSFAHYKDKFFPFDPHLKSMIEYLISDHGTLNGFKIYWPNGQTAIYQRKQSTCHKKNLNITDEGVLELEPGKKHLKPSDFSPLLPSGQEPCYGSKMEKRLIQWPLK